MSFKEKVNQAKKQLNINNDQISELTGIPKSTLNKIMSGETKNPSMSYLALIADTLDVSLDYLMKNRITDPNYGKFTQPDYSQQVLFTHFNKLNKMGQRKAIENTEELTYVPRYQKNGENELTVTMDIDNHNSISYDLMGDTSEPLVFVKVFNEKASAGLGLYLSDNSNDGFEMIAFPKSQVPNGTDFAIQISGDSMEPKIFDGDVVYVKATPQVDFNDIGVFIVDGEAYCKKIVRERNGVVLRSLNKRYKDILLTKHMVIRTIGEVLW